MKIEKISDNQIRCRLTKEDLAERQIRLSELAYGSEKARSLFRDMMLQANREYGFTNDANIPLMIEAIPSSGNSLTIVITKVEDPEELDTRFAKFSPTAEVADGIGEPPVEGADDIIDMFQKLFEAKAGAARRKSEGEGDAQQKAPSSKGSARGGRRKNEGTAPGQQVSLTRVFRFARLDDVIAACASLRPLYKGASSLYHMEGQGTYMLVVHQALTPEDFNRVCNILSEYGSSMQGTASTEAYLREHASVVADSDAVEKLASIIREHSG